MSPKPLLPVILAYPFSVRASYAAKQSFSFNRSPSLFSRLLGRTHPDTPSASLYRLYEAFIHNWNIKFRDELEYFCRGHPDWAISSIPEPADPDPVRRAILAVLVQFMCDSFNRRIEYGLPRDAPPIVTDFAELAARPKVFEVTPDWAKRVEPLDERLYIPNREGKVLDWNHEDVSEEFKAMNIIVQMPHVHFI